METVRLALVGFSGYGWSLARHILTASADGSCRLVAAAENRMSAAPERVEKLRVQGVELFDDALKMLDALKGRCDAIYIATGPTSHEALATAAFVAGLPVHLEKPAAPTVQEVDRLVAAMERSGKFCLVGFHAVHSDDIRFVKERVVDGRLGRVERLVCWANWPRGRGYYDHSDWLGRLRVGEQWVLDGPATNALAHQVTNILLLASAEPNRLAIPASVRAELYVAGPITGHDTAAIEIVTAAGQTAVLLVSHCGAEPFGPVIEIEAARGRVFWEQKTGAKITYTDGRTESCAAPADMGRAAMIANFVQAVRRGDGGELRCPLAESRAETLVVNGAHESSEAIHRIDPACCRTVEDEQWRARKVVDGLNELLAEAARRRCLLSDVPGAPPWVVATERFDLAGYRQFPQRFRSR